MARFWTRGVCVALAAVLVCSVAFAQDGRGGVQTDGLDSNTVPYDNPVAPPDRAWRENRELFQRVDKLTNACFTACHGAEKRAADPKIPNIAGQPYYYLLKQLETLNENNPGTSARNAHHWTIWARENFYMDEITAKVSPELYVYIADLVSGVSCRVGGGTAPQGAPPAPPKMLDRCTSCHGLDGQGRVPNVPYIAGQPYVYLRDQLVLMQNAARQAERQEGENWRSKPLAAPFIEDLSERDIRQVTRYYSALDCRGVKSSDEQPAAQGGGDQ